MVNSLGNSGSGWAEVLPRRVPKFRNDREKISMNLWHRKLSRARDKISSGNVVPWIPIHSMIRRLTRQISRNLKATGTWIQSGRTIALIFHYSDVIMSAMVSRITSLTIFLLNCLFRHRSKKTSELRVTGLCEGNSPVTGEFPAQRVNSAENVSIWWRHYMMGDVCEVPERSNHFNN